MVMSKMSAVTSVASKANGFEGNVLLRDAMKSMLLTQSWQEVKATVANELQIYFRPRVEKSEGDAPTLMEKATALEREEQLQEQLILELIGPEFRILWDVQESYRPELLREPYLIASRRGKMSLDLTKQLFDKIDDLSSVTLNSNGIASANVSAGVGVAVDGGGVEKVDIGADGGMEPIQNNLSNEAIQQFRRDAARILLKLISFKENKELSSSTRQIVEKLPGYFDSLGASLVSTMKSEDLSIRLLSAPSFSSAAADDASNASAKRTMEQLLDGNNNNNSSSNNADGEINYNVFDEDANILEIAEILDGIQPAMMDEICAKLRGTLLSESLRSCIWAYRYLSRGRLEPLLGPTCVRELARLSSTYSKIAAAKKKAELLSSSSSSASSSATSSPVKHPPPPPMTDLISRAVHSAISAAFEISNCPPKPPSTTASIATNTTIAKATNSIAVPSVNKDSSSSSSSSSSNSNTFQEIPVGVSALGSLARRAEILVHAAYCLTGSFSDRTVMVSLLVLRAFPSDPPTSEKILRITRRITTECLPSEQLHKEYSLASVAQAVWKLLFERDPALYSFLQHAENLTSPPEPVPLSPTKKKQQQQQELGSSASKSTLGHL